MRSLKVLLFERHPIFSRAGLRGVALEKLKELYPTDTDTDTDTGTGTEVIEGEINWERLRDSWSGLGTVFPFCIPWDLVNMFRGFESEAIRPPIYELNIMPFIKDNAGIIKFDLAMPEFDVIRKIVRSGFLLLFGFGLALVTRKVIKW